MGSALGHLATFKPVIDRALAVGHRVVLVAKELDNIHVMFDIRELCLLQSPYLVTPTLSRLPISWTESLIPRYRSTAKFANHLAAWRSLFDVIQPDLVVYDSSPAALVASLGSHWLKWTVGNAFSMPRMDLPFVGVYPSAHKGEETVERLRKSEEIFLSMVNDSLLLAGFDQKIGDLREIPAQADRELLKMAPQFDYFSARSTGEYVGVPAPALAKSAVAPCWPATSRFKVFAYLKNFPGLERFLASLEQAGVSAVIYIRGLAAATKKKFAGHLFLDGPACMDVVCAEADLVIHMAGFQTVSRCMQVGVPQLLIALGMEQLFTAKSAQKLGAALVTDGEAKNYGVVISQALLHASKGRRMIEACEPALLDGTRYATRMAELVDQLA